MFLPVTDVCRHFISAHFLTGLVKPYALLFFFQGLVFKTLETLVLFDSDLVTALIPACKQAVIQLEQKRGVGTDMQLR